MELRTASPVLAALIDEIIPEDEVAGGWDGGVARYVEREWNGDLLWSHRAVEQATADFGSAFLQLNAIERTARWNEYATAPATAATAHALIRLAREGYYGGSSEAPPAGWDLLGYRPWPFADAPRPNAALPGIARGEARARYDVIVIGSGPGGGVAARVLAEAGASVLLVERAAPLTDAQLIGDHLHGKRMALYRPDAGPGPGNPRAVVEVDGTEWAVDGTASGDEWGLNAMVLGGGTRVWQGMAWRFLPEDFSMATDYGVPKGSSLVDWPISYDELAPAYDWAERELGVSGATGPLTARMPHHPGYVMPPLPSDPIRDLLGGAAGDLGWSTDAIPFAINSVPRDGRPACAACHQCMGHACPVNAKNGSHTAFIPQALATGRCDLLYDAQVVGIEHDDGTASGVVIGIGDSQMRIACGTLVVAAGAIETPRLLLAAGLGNDHVGRHLQGHAVTLLVGRTAHAVPTFRGPGHSVATMRFVHDGEGTIGGGVLFDAFAPYPLQLAGWADRMTGARWGAPHKSALRRTLGHVVGVMSMAQEVPHPDARVELHPDLRDRRGVRAVRIRHAVHPATMENRGNLGARSREWLEAAGCTDIADIFSYDPDGPPMRRSPASEHSAGTVRMGHGPRSSAADEGGLVWGTSNVFVCDGSLHPTNGSVNPTLTLIANAYRVASGIACRVL